MTAPRNALEQKLQKTAREANQPNDEQDRIGYAIITDIDQNSSQVKIRLLQSDGTPGEDIPGGFLPLMNTLEDIHLRFGALQKDMICRIHWKGRLKPKNPVVEVIAPPGHSFLRKAATINEIETGPRLIFSGGI